MLQLTRDDYVAIVAHARKGLPNEVCGLVAGTLDGDEVELVYPCRNADESPVVYTLDPLDHLRADRDAEKRGLEIIGVYHSHTRTEAYPSPTDVAKAPDPAWHYILVSLRDYEPVMRSFHIVDGEIKEEKLLVV